MANKDIIWDNLYKFVVDKSVGRRIVFLALIAVLLAAVVAGIGYLRMVTEGALETSQLITLQFLSTLASVLFFAAIYAIFDSTSAKQQFEECVQEIRRQEAEQTRFGVTKITRGDKFFKIISSMDIEENDHIEIMWSFLQHEEVTDNFFRFAERKNLTVRILIFLPFGYAVRQRAKDVRRSYLDESFSAVAAKSLANLDFLKRYAHKLHTQSTPIWPRADDEDEPVKPIDAFSKNLWPLNDNTDLWPSYAVGHGGPPHVDLPDRKTIEGIRRQVEGFLNELKEGEKEARRVTAQQKAAEAAQVEPTPSQLSITIDKLLTDVEVEESPEVKPALVRVRQKIKALMASWDMKRAQDESAPGRKETNAEQIVSVPKGSVAIRFTDRYTARPMVIVRRPAAEVAVGDDGPPALYVAMGMFLNNESSKYPFIVYRRPTDDSLGGQAAVDICDDAAKHFFDRWNNARFWSSVETFSAQVTARFSEFVDDLEARARGNPERN